MHIGHGASRKAVGGGHGKVVFSPPRKILGNVPSRASDELMVTVE
jgi:hypothetical protein